MSTRSASPRSASCKQLYKRSACRRAYVKRRHTNSLREFKSCPELHVKVSEHAKLSLPFHQSRVCWQKRASFQQVKSPSFSPFACVSFRKCVNICVEDLPRGTQSFNHSGATHPANYNIYSSYNAFPAFGKMNVVKLF